MFQILQKYVTDIEVYNRDDLHEFLYKILKEEKSEEAGYTFLKHQKEYSRLTTDKYFNQNAIDFVAGLI